MAVKNVAHKCDTKDNAGFTLIELVVVITIIAIAGGLFFSKGFGIETTRDETLVRRLSETITFLHHQAVQDQSFYVMEFDLKHNSYRVGVVKNDSDISTINAGSTSSINNDIGLLSLELAEMQNPDPGSTQTIIPPPTFPSLFNPTIFPEGTVIEDIQNAQGTFVAGEEEPVTILFSPRRFSDFAVIHLRLVSAGPVTIVANPFTGITEIIRARKDFTASYGRQS